MVDTDSREAAIAFAELYPGAIDLAVTDLRCQAEEDRDFVATLRSLPTGSHAAVVRVEGRFDRDSLVHAVRRVSPMRDEPGDAPHARNTAVFWGSAHDPDVTGVVQ